MMTPGRVRTRPGRDVESRFSQASGSRGATLAQTLSNATVSPSNLFRPCGHPETRERVERSVADCAGAPCAAGGRDLAIRGQGPVKDRIQDGIDARHGVGDDEAPAAGACAAAGRYSHSGVRAVLA